ncbi:hypothetical protein [Escherichia coli]|uniref:hypothetical protein n=1 Tax=Escherichia coli TaxID=562 RepID=UPI00201B1BF1|nr:hypothetical protein [Escherichia coli]
MMNNLINRIALTFLALVLTGCTAGKIDPAKALTQMHIVKSDDYKKRPGWPALVRLGTDDCETYKSGGGSLFKWDGLTCNDKSIILAVNSKPQTIPVFYAAYHEYGSYGVGELSNFDNSTRTGEEASKILVNLTTVLNNPAKVDAIYADYEKDRWSMGLGTVNESDFKKSLATFAQERDKLASEYHKLRDANQKRYLAERDERIKREKEEAMASEKTIDLVLWQNPTVEQQMVVDALHTIKFTIRNDGVAYANGRRFMSIAGMEYLRNSLALSMESCSDAGAYVGDTALNRACIQGLARNIVEWGKTANDRSISDRTWNAAAMDGSINYNPIKYEILFSHWAGMARVYSARRY